MGQFEALLVEAVEDFKTDAGTAFAASLLPAGHRLLAGGDQCLVVTDGILDIQVDAVGRLFATCPAALARLPKLELIVEMALERLLAVFCCRFTIGLGARHLVIGGPVTTGVDGIEGAFECGAVFFQQGMGHRYLLGDVLLGWW